MHNQFLNHKSNMRRKSGKVRIGTTAKMMSERMMECEPGSWRVRQNAPYGKHTRFWYLVSHVVVGDDGSSVGPFCSPSSISTSTRITMERINIDEPRYDQSTYWGRAKHFFTVTNPLNLWASYAQLDRAKDIVTRYRNGEKLPLTEDELWYHKNLYDSAHHPETGERQLIFGRMSAQVPANMLITGCMLTFYKSPSQVIFWQWFNQSFNAVVNYTNRSGSTPISSSQLVTSYVCATGGALATALGLNSLTKLAPPLIGRFVPFCAVAAANCINIPMMRSRELGDGIMITDENGKPIGKSKKAATIAISQVVMSRIGMAVPGMLLPPVLMNHLERKGTLRRYPKLGAPLQVAVCGFFLIFTTPLCCALFPQKSSIAIADLEPEIQEAASKLDHKPVRGYYNKGL